MEEQNYKKIINDFKLKIREYEDILFGMNLFIQGVSFMWEHNKEIVDLNQQHYNNAKERMDKAINEAKNLVEKVKECSDNISLLQEFQFPPIKGNPVLDQGTERFKVLSQAYNELFPNRPKNKPFTREEHKQLTEVAMNKMGLG
jgi:uncharacterized phage infection (PIP) family protein YhgE